MHNGHSLKTALREVSLWVAVVPILFPIYLLVSLSFKTQEEAAESGLALPKQPTLSNYTSVLTETGTASVTFGRAALNSVIITVAVVLVVVAITAPAGYVLARRTSVLSKWMFAIFSLGIILPVYLGIVPLFAFIVRYNLVGTMIGLVLIYTGLFSPLGVFLYAHFFRALPSDYEEAAQVDGARPIRAFVNIVLPLVRPVTGTVAVFVGILVWKDFLHPLLFLGGTENVTLPVAIHSLVGEHVAQWNLVFASIVIALAPILAVYGVMQRYVVRGFTSAVRQ